MTRFWNVIRHENDWCCSLTEQSLFAKDAEHWIQNQLRKAAHHGVYSEEGIGRLTGNELVRGLYLPNAMILHMLTRRVHFNRVAQDAPATELLTPPQMQLYRAVVPFYDVAANDDPVPL